MKSRYLGIEVEIPEQTIVSAGEEVRIIPHSVLEELILNSESAIEKKTSVHYTPISSNEPGHYIFLCAISDACGRRVESIGESLGNTLDTEIAKNYPALMAFKRAFDDAAIKYLGLDGKVYSDNQCARDDADGSTKKPASVNTSKPVAKPEPGSATFGVSDADDEDEDNGTSPAAAPAAASAAKPAPASAAKSARKTAAKQGAVSFGVDIDEDEDDEPEAPKAAPKKADVNRERREAAARERAQSRSNAIFGGGVPIVAEEEYEEETFEESTPAISFGFTEEADTEDALPEEPGAAPDASEENVYSEDDGYPADDDALADESGARDKFDTKLEFGHLEGSGLTIRSAYADSHEDFIWATHVFTPRTPNETEIQALCLKYEEAMKILEG